MIPEGFSQVTLKFTGSAVPTGANVVFGVDNTLDQTPANVAGDVAAAITTGDIMNRLSTNISITSILVKNGPDLDGPAAEVAVSKPGGSAGDTWPNAAILVTKVTALGGRKNKGRMFFPGIIEADVNQGGQISATPLAAFGGDFTDFLTALNTNGVPMVVLHDDPLLAPTAVTTLEVSPTLATQRRRIRR